MLVPSAIELKRGCLPSRRGRVQNVFEGKILLTHSLLTAIKVFYDQNIISVELFKLGDVTTPAGSDLSLTKRLMARFNGSCSVLDQCSQIFNTIDLDNLVIRSEAMFPSLQSMVVHTDGTTKPSTSLFEIFLDCDNSPAIITDAKFCNIGCFTTLTRSGFALTVKFRELAELWQEISELSFSSRMRAVHGFGIRDDSLASWTHQAFLDRLIFEKSGDDSTSEDMRTFREGLALKYYPHSKTLGLDDNAYWTHVASPYEPYDYDSWFWALNN
jgi:hypothetical protein